MHHSYEQIQRDEDEVRGDLECIVRERVEALWEMGITGGGPDHRCRRCRAPGIHSFAPVKYANGEEVPASRFLAEVEGVGLEKLLEKIFGIPRSGVAAVDGPNRFYVRWDDSLARIDAGS